MYKVFGLRLGASYGVRPALTKTFLRLTVEKIRVRLQFSPRNIYGHMAVVTPL